MKMVEPSCSSLMSMLEPFFHGRMVLTGAIGSLAPPLRGEGSSGSIPTASVPGNGRSGSTIPGANSARLFATSSLKNSTCPSGNSAASAPMVGKSLPGRLKLVPTSLGTILRMRISITSPGSAPST